MAVSLKKPRKVDLSKPPIEQKVMREYTPEHLTDEYSPEPELKEYTPQHQAAEIIQVCLDDREIVHRSADEHVHTGWLIVTAILGVATFAICIIVCMFILSNPAPETETEFSLGMMKALDDAISVITSPGVILSISFGVVFLSSLRLISRIGGGRP